MRRLSKSFGKERVCHGRANALVPLRRINYTGPGGRVLAFPVPLEMLGGNLAQPSTTAEDGAAEDELDTEVRAHIDEGRQQRRPYAQGGAIGTRSPGPLRREHLGKVARG